MIKQGVQAGGQAASKRSSSKYRIIISTEWLWPEYSSDTEVIFQPSADLCLHVWVYVCVLQSKRAVMILHDINIFTSHRRLYGVRIENVQHMHCTRTQKHTPENYMNQIVDVLFAFLMLHTHAHSFGMVCAKQVHT